MTARTPSREQDLDALLERISGYPTGDAESWKERYAPLVHLVTEHRQVSAPPVSVVVVAWNTADLVIECLDRIRSQAGFRSRDIEIVLVDNGGLDRVRQEIAERVDIEIRMIGNVRLCRARNLGVAHAHADIVTFIDDDGLVEPTYFERALAYFEDPDVVAVRSKIIEKHHPYFTTLGDHYDRGPVPVEDCLVTEGSTTLQREPYIAVGGFAESLAGHEGIDLSFRLLRHHEHGRILYAPDVVMRHDYYDSWRKYLRKSLSYAEIDSSVAARDPELAAFMQSYFRRRFDHGARPVHQRAARAGLRGLRTALQTFARARHKARKARRILREP